MATEVETTKALAKKFIERSNALKYSGVKRDNAALDYFCGAASMAELSGNVPLMEHLTRIITLLIAVRGYIAVAELAREGTWDSSALMR
jgi:hypothetical protein